MAILGISQQATAAHEHRYGARWPWQQIDTSKISFPSEFVFGVATAAYQDGGALTYPQAQFARWEQVAGLEPSLRACEGWERAEEDIALLQELGVTAIRLSLDWSKIEPTQGVIDHEAIAHYHKLFQALRDADIKVMVTLHHFVHPMWFENLGAFEKEENTAHFINFVRLAFREFHSYATWWCTINEPSVYMLQGYLRGVMPPGNSVPGLADPRVTWGSQGAASLTLGLTVLKNMLRAHVDAYCAIHDAYRELGSVGKAPVVGFAHSCMVFENFHSVWFPMCGLVEYSIARAMTTLTNDAVLEFFKTGHFSVKVPLVGHVAASDARAPHSLDYIGINYYAHVFLKLYPRLKDTLHPGYHEDDIQTDMPYAIYAEGLYRAIAHVSTLGVPMYITENGISDARDDRREIWLRRYLFALSEALGAGFDVRGYFYWTLLDNWEWDQGYAQHFGLYAVDPQTQRRSLKNGARYYADLAARHKARR